MNNENTVLNYCGKPGLSRKTEILTEKQLLEIIEGWSDSEDGFSEGDDEEIIGDSAIEEILDGELIPAVEDGPDDIFDLENLPVDVIFENNTCVTLPNINEEVSDIRNLYKKILWKNTSFEIDQSKNRYIGDQNFPATVLRLNTSLQFFNFFLTKRWQII